MYEYMSRYDYMSSRDQDIDFDDAIELADGSYINERGTIVWYNEEGCYHREDGPAVIYPDGDVEWFIKGEWYSFDDWCIELNKSDEDKMMLRLQYG
jgi:hypothetical protein